MPEIPKRFSNKANIAVVLALCVCGLSCTGSEDFYVDASFSLARGELVIAFTSNRDLSSYEILGEEKAIVLKSPIGGMRSGQIRVPSGIRNSGKFIKFLSDRGELQEYQIPFLSSQLAIRSQFEAEEDASGSLLIAAGSESSIAVDLGETATSAAYLRLEVSKPLGFNSPDGRQDSIEIPLQRGAQSVGGISIIAANVPNSEVASILARIFSDKREELASASRKVSIRPLHALHAAVNITNSALPADPDANSFGGRREGFVDLGSKANSRLAGADAYPLTQQSITLENSLSEAISLLVTVEVQTDAGKSATAFNVPPYKPGPNVTSAVLLEGGASKTIYLPFYAKASQTVPGKYQRLITVKLAGSSAVVAEALEPFEVGRSVNLALLTTGFLAALSLFIFSWLLMRRSRIFDRFSTRQIVLAGLFSAASVVIVNVPVYFLTSITVFLLGPMGFLVDGLLSEFVFFALLTVLISIVPVQGICATVIGTRFLLGGVLLGMVTPVGILHAVTTGFVLEAAVFLSGEIRKRGLHQLHTGVRIRLVLLFALANALISWVGFQLAIVLFRLHYADWYILLSVVIGGFLYALLGGFAGRKIGKKLAEAVP